MAGPPPAVAATRLAVRAHLGGLGPQTLVLAACSGGVDSLALAAALAFEAEHHGVRGGALVVDHALQPGSKDIADTAAAVCRSLGLDPVEVLAVRVEPGAGGGPEAKARAARYAALEAAAERLGSPLVLLGHTQDDQAEQVLLGLARGSGARSLGGMPVRRGRFARPFLGLGRRDTAAVCTAYGLRPWQDPHNADRSYARVRARQALDHLEADLGPGLTEALARSAALLRDDAELLDTLAAQARGRLGRGPVDVLALRELPGAVRRRVLRLLAVEAGALPGSLSSGHLRDVDALVNDWHGQGPVDLPGRVVAARRGTALSMSRAEAVR
ncbi:MAG: tRNA lysidine(34) synthetase TilS [Dermatophilaceae bacterium]